MCSSEVSLMCSIDYSLISIGMRDQALDWHTAPPVQVLSFLVLGSEKDAKSKMVSLVYILFTLNYI